MFEELKELELLEIDGGCWCMKTGGKCKFCLSPFKTAVCKDV